MKSAMRGGGIAAGAVGGRFLDEKLLKDKVNGYISGGGMIIAGQFAPALLGIKDETLRSVFDGVSAYGGIKLAEQLGLFGGGGSGSGGSGSSGGGGTVAGIGTAETYLVQDDEYQEVSGNEDGDNLGNPYNDDDRAQSSME